MAENKKIFRYDSSGRWFKGNTHLHSTVSDGGLEFRGLAELYRSAGYHFLFRTDHRVASRIGNADTDAGLLWLDGIELDGKDRTGAYYHVVCLGRLRNLRPEAGLEAALAAARRQGALLILAHPYWSGNTLDDCLRHPFNGIEIYNHIAHWLNGKSCGLVHWDAALAKNPDTFAIAADDGHLSPEHPGWNGGWVVVNAPELSAAAITDALRTGNFYASQGPEINAVTLEDGRLRLETSPIRFARLVGPGTAGARLGSFDGPLLREAAFTLPADWDYIYAEIEDERGRRAWTNNLFTALPPGENG